MNIGFTYCEAGGGHDWCSDCVAAEREKAFKAGAEAMRGKIVDYVLPKRLGSEIAEAIHSLPLPEVK